MLLSLLILVNNLNAKGRAGLQPLTINGQTASHTLMCVCNNKTKKCCRKANWRMPKMVQPA